MLVIILKPFSLFIAGLRGTSILINTWIEMLSDAIYFGINLFWRFVFWTLSVVTLPVRALLALRREKQLHEQLCELQDRLDSLAWDRKELQEHLQIALKEQETLETVLGELEDEHDAAIHKIKLLEAELRGLKDENLRLKEAYGKSQWDTDSRVDATYDCGKKRKDGISLWKFNHCNGGVSLTDVLMHKDTLKDENKGTFDACDFFKNDGTSMMHRVTPGVIERSVLDNIHGERMEVAFSQSLFSTVLSLLVGMTIWEAQDPCIPLVTALFMVVCMSLKSVVQLFTTIKNTPASDAVALLSLNCFLLGTLAYPTLPIVARLSAPLFSKSLGRALGWFWF
uniref:uncharacterized protein LOC122580065 n=1 Tax=Erigeron canadensis TaxID=72917 RepID=UPI001CB92D96|nr:uncharacterized protein LOC122580065 [Erigeron canadensis]